MTIEELWLRTLQTVCGRAAHEIKGAMNGVAVNLEVVRSRAERGDAVAADVLRYGTSAADQLGALIAMTEGVLGLARAGHEPADIDQVARQLVAVLEPVGRSAGRTFELLGVSGESAMTGAPLSAVRLTLAAALLSASDRGDVVTCTIRSPVDRDVVVSPAVAGDSDLSQVLDAVAEVGIVAKTDGHGISIRFPPIGHHGRTLSEVG